MDDKSNQCLAIAGKGWCCFRSWNPKGSRWAEATRNFSLQDLDQKGG